MEGVAMNKLVIALALGAGAALAQAPAQAQWYNQTPTPSRYYFGLAATSADTDFKVPGTARRGETDWETSWKAFAGVDYDPWIGAELGYIDARTDDFEYVANGVNGRVGSRGYNIYLAAKGRYPIPMFPQAEVFGKAGVEYSHRKLDAGPFLSSTSDDNVGPYVAVGAQWHFNPQWAVVAEYERFGRSKNIGASADMLTVGLRFNFGPGPSGQMFNR
jgi:opacity protein-like surface antigen